LIVGLVAGAVYLLAAQIWPGPVASVLAVIAAAWVSGGLHEEGWSDLFDALAASRQRERMLEVMKDSHIGAIGALALIFLVTVKLAALTALPAARVLAALVSAHVLSRWSHLPLLRLLPYARTGGGLAGAMAGRVSTARLAFGSLLACSISGLVLGRLALPVLIAAAAASAASGWLFRVRLGGVTGDCLGAANQLVELCTLLILAARWPSLL
jgi:adenosylcobinamide-GDP ribazoletransferase